MKSKKILILFSLFLFLVSCRKIEPSWEVSAYAPLLKTTLDFSKIVPDSLLQTNPDNSLSLIYRYFFYNFSLDSLVNLPDTLSHKYLPPLGGIALNPGQTFLNFSENSHLAVQNAEISRVDFESGFLVFEIFTTFTEKTIVTYKMPYATRDGLSFEISELVPAATPGSVLHYEKLFDISDYSIDMRGPSGLSSNILTNATTATLDPTGNTYNVTDQDVFSFNVRFKDISIKYAKGYFGSSSYVFGPDTSSVNIFKNIADGTVDLETVKLFLNVENRFGIDAQVVFDNFTSINTHTNHFVELNDPIIGQTLNISRATETGNPLAPVIPSTYFFDISSSNIAELIENMPDMISYKMRIISNPLGNISSGNDFIYYGNYMNASLDMEIPLSLIANDFTLADTLPLKLGEKPGNPTSGILKLIVDNGFPFSANIQFYTIDENNHINDSILIPDLISAPLLNTNYMVIGSKRTEIVIPVSEDRLTSFYQAKKILIVARFNTAGANHHVKIYNFYKMDIKLTGDFNYLIQI